MTKPVIITNIAIITAIVFDMINIIRENYLKLYNKFIR